MIEHKETEELPFLVERHQKEIWAWKQKESQWIKDQNSLEGSRRIIEELSTKIIEIEKDKNILDGCKRIVDELSTKIVELTKDNKRLTDQLATRIEQLTKAGF